MAVAKTERRKDDGRRTIFSSLILRPASLAVLSAILLILSFPLPSLGFLAWVALVPLLVAINTSASRIKAIKLTAITGLVFYGISLHWLIYVSTFGWIFLTLLETFFFVLWGWSVYAGRDLKHSLLRIFWLAIAWTTFEWVRSEIPVFGFGWNLLGYSQAAHPWIRMAANAVGAYGLGFGIVMVNACILELLRQGPRAKGQEKTIPGTRHPALGATLGTRYTSLGTILVLFTLLLAHGAYHSKSKNTSPKKTLRISLIQANIPQSVKWEVMARGRILELHKNLTELAVYEDPDLIVWPEASFPGYFNHDQDAQEVRKLARKFEMPLLVGAPHFLPPEDAFNSAYLLGIDGEVKQRYDKQYLVPFGEYVPLKPIFGFLEKIAYSLGVSDFSAGKEKTVFRLGSPTSATKKADPSRIFGGKPFGDDASHQFSVLICFEDIFPNLARAFVDRGADFLAVMTNDAWFGPTAAPYQHLQASIFRAIENGVPVIRAANTGVSAFISEKGRVLDRVRGPKGRDTFVAGYKTLSIPVGGISDTRYRRGGWIFPYWVSAGFVILFLRLQTSDLRRQTGSRSKE